MKSAFFKDHSQIIKQFESKLFPILWEIGEQYTSIHFIFSIAALTEKYVFNFSPLTKEARILSEVNALMYRVKKQIKNLPEKIQLTMKLFPRSLAPFLIAIMEKLKTFPFLNKALPIIMDDAIHSYTSYAKFSSEIEQMNEIPLISKEEAPASDAVVTKNSVYGTFSK